MSKPKFKVGDKVQRIAEYLCNPFEKDLPYIVQDCTARSITFEEISGSFCPERFKLAPEKAAKSELEQLVDKANEGLLALGKLYDRRNEVEVYDVDGIQSQIKCVLEELGNVPSGFHIGKFKYRIKPKPKFEPYTIESTGWKVAQSIDMIHIGCTEFRIDHLNEVLQKLLGGAAYHCIDKGGLDSQEFYATRTGIKYGKHILPWADAEVLYNKLKEIEKC